MKNLKISEELHKTVKTESAKDGVMIQQFVEAALQNWISNRWKKVQK